MKFNNIYFTEYKDQFNLYNLIKTINPYYRLYFNNKNKKYYIININKNFEICKEFLLFSGNILHDLRFFKVENMNKIIKFIETENSELDYKRKLEIIELLNNSSKEIMNLCNRSKLINEKDINKIIGEIKC